jgi:ergothioneine biosynthesis protein EgtB
MKSDPSPGSCARGGSTYDVERGAVENMESQARHAPVGLRARYDAVRAFTEALCAPLCAEDYVVQSMPDASPTKWHLAHTTWFFETFLLSAVPGYELFDGRFGFLFNSYYVSVGQRHCRPRRGLLSRPTVEETYRYRRYVDARMRELIGDIEAGRHPELAFTALVGVHHEQQHQELLITDLKHAMAQNPLRPAVWGEAQPGASGPARRAAAARDGGGVAYVAYDEGVRWLGHAGGGFAFDNEAPRHRVFVHAFALSDRPVTCGEYLAFMEDGGYARPELWLSSGWNAAVAHGWEAPLYWERRDGRWWLFTLHGMREVDPGEPVCHVSHYEADAYARWAGARLPTEPEWETAATELLAGAGAHEGVDGNFAESGRAHPAPVSAPSQPGVPRQLFGDVWEWTASAYAPYPGFRPWPGALGEYNGKFMSDQLVLRGGSCATPRSHIRATYRNFFPPDARWQMTGLRLARDR